MAYSKTNWQNGDIITAAKLNKMEQGVADIAHVLYPINVEVTRQEMPGTVIFTADKTYAEALGAIEDGKLPFYIFHDGSTILYYPAWRKVTTPDRIEVVDTTTQYIVHDSSGVHTEAH